MRSQSFEENGIRITVRPETIEDALDTDMLTFQIGTVGSARENFKRARFIQLVLISTVEGELGFAWPSADSSVRELLEAYEQWKQLPANLIRQWAAAIEAVNATPNDPNLTPAVSEKKEATPA